jgi:hypothetical protein
LNNCLGKTGWHLTKFAKQLGRGPVKYIVMRQLPKNEAGLKKNDERCGNETNRKITTKLAADLPDLTFDQLTLRCNSETAVLRRILDFPVFR